MDGTEKFLRVTEKFPQGFLYLRIPIGGEKCKDAWRLRGLNLHVDSAVRLIWPQQRKAMRSEKNNLETVIDPFLKWAGGKRWLTQSHARLFPVHFKRYFEPFLGGASVFFHLKPDQALLSDINEELINAYQAIKTDWGLVWRYLKDHHRQHGSKYYYRVRAQSSRSAASRAARLIYLNRTCWNGLYRVNLSGDFNVPIGTKKWAVSESDDFAAIASSLANARLVCNDFEATIDEAAEGDLIFADPPYTVKHNFNGFVKYNEKLFSWEDQERLAVCLMRARNRGASIVSTNANHPSVVELYKNEFELTTATRASIIAGDSRARGRFSELIIKSI